MRIIRAEDLADPIHVEDARIAGVLDLEGQRLSHPLILRNCYVEEEINLRRAEIPHVDLSGSHLWGLDAKQLRTRDDVDLRDVVTAGTEVSLIGARVDGCLLLSGARLSNVNGHTLVANGIEVAQDVYGLGLTSVGWFSLRAAHIKGELHLPGVRLFNPRRPALTADRLEVGGLNCNGLKATGGVSLMSASISGDAGFDGAKLADGLTAAGLVVGGAAHFKRGFTARGQVVLSNARIGTNLVFIDATLSCPVDVALAADSISVGRHADFTRLTAHGKLRLASGHIKGTLRFPDARLSNLGDDALDVQSATVDQHLSLQRCEVTGGVRLDSALVRGHVLLTDVRIGELSADVLVVERDFWCSGTAAGRVWARGLRVGQDAAFRGEFADEVALPDAHVGGRLTFTKATMTKVGLDGARATTLRFRPAKAIDELDLTDATVGSFEDDPETWPEKVWLRGFTYDLLEHDHAPVKHRVGWLHRHPEGYTPGLYDTLAAAYKRAGRLNFTRKVNIAKQWDRRAEFGPFGRAWNWLLYLVVGYGYRPMLAGAWLLALLGAGTAVYANTTPTATAPVVEAFNPFVYALDVMLPIVDLGQQKAWVVQGPAQWCSWALIAAGWVLTTAVVAGLTNALKRD
ncbi:hypothetical protein FKR81_21710 [Lentzea tibetensis]|uniref:Membrane-associated oxidoreductase n=1 Tax=Lentzea tibetensis TaxID=2591470 RepID=A0A563ET54_9PSEU|nr:hypothetical protein [Lentzea tibetensis]TWP50314.1 hypothetical protein FKR81_21710 [Lentzea tibetensis]